jgi:hypothetical protein
MRICTKIGALVMFLTLFVYVDAALSHPINVMQKTSATESELPPGTAGPYSPNQPDIRF